MTRPQTVASRALATASMACRNSATVNDEGTTMNNTTTQAPKWMHREPLSRAQAVDAVQAEARRISQQAFAAQCRDISAGLEAQSKTLARIAGAVMRSEPLDTATAAHGAALATSRKACAVATTEPKARAAYMDQSHAIAEALRYTGRGL